MQGRLKLYRVGCGPLPSEPVPAVGTRVLALKVLPGPCAGGTEAREKHKYSVISRSNSEDSLKLPPTPGVEQSFCHHPAESQGEERREGRREGRMERGRRTGRERGKKGGLLGMPGGFHLDLSPERCMM